MNIGMESSRGLLLEQPSTWHVDPAQGGSASYQQIVQLAKVPVRRPSGWRKFKITHYLGSCDLTVKVQSLEDGAMPNDVRFGYFVVDKNTVLVTVLGEAAREVPLIIVMVEAKL